MERLTFGGSEEQYIKKLILWKNRGAIILIITSLKNLPQPKLSRRREFQVHKKVVSFYG